MKLNLDSTLQTTVKLGSERSVTLGLTRPTNSDLCGPNTLIANIDDGSALPSFFTFTENTGNLSVITEENGDIASYIVVFTSTSDYHTNPALT